MGDNPTVSNVLMHDTIAMMPTVHEDPRWKELLAGMLKQIPKYSKFTPVTLIYGPESLPLPRVLIPTFSRLPFTGQLTSCRRTPMGPIRLHLVGAMAEAGHVHEDKGSFILEAFGETLATDRGMTPYEDPRCPVLTWSVYHSLLTPVLPDGSFPHQLNPCQVAIIPEGEGDEQRLSASNDTTPAWNGLFKKHMRRIESPHPELFLIFDEAHSGTFSKALASEGIPLGPYSGCVNLLERYPIKSKKLVQENIFPFWEGLKWRGGHLRRQPMPLWS